MPLTIQTIEELESILAKESAVTFQDEIRMRQLMNDTFHSLLSAARWALLKGFKQE
jgi:hypothetical protein